MLKIYQNEIFKKKMIKNAIKYMKRNEYDFIGEK